MGRKDYQPTNQKNNFRLDPITQDSFAGGAVHDVPHTDIADDAIADGENIVLYPGEAQGRPGCQEYGTQSIPALTGRSGLNGTKAGFRITSTNAAFTQDDVGNYFVWPGDDEYHEEITKYISGTVVETAESGTRNFTAGCFIRGKQNIWHFHTQLKLFLLQWGDEFYVGNLDLTTFTKVRIVSRDKPYNSVGTAIEFDEYSWLVFNSYGTFKIDTFNTSDYISYKINLNQPARSIDEQAETVDTDYHYGFIYSAARINGSDRFRDRLSPSRIEIETGTNPVNTDYQDYVDIHSEEPIGPATYTYQKTTGTPLHPTNRTADAWQAVTFGTFNITVNGTAHEVSIDFSDVTTMVDVANAIQESMRDYWPQATCEYITSHLELTSGRIRGGTISLVTDGTNGTNIAPRMRCGAGGGAVVSTETIDQGLTIGPLYVPRVANTSAVEYEWHLTHFPMYRTMDQKGLYQQGTSEAALNDPERYVWEKDLRINAAVYGRKFNGHILLYRGQFEEADIGSTVEWEDGSRDTILDYVAPDDVIYNTDTAYTEESIFMAGMLGNGRVARVSQTGTTVTRTHGTTFSSDDVGKTVKWSDGYRSVIESVTDANTIEVYDSQDRPVQGITLDSTYRYYHSLVSDDTLRSRQADLLCRNRFRQPLPNNNVAAQVPGYLITCRRGQGTIDYCEVIDGYKYLAGNYFPGYQRNETISDDIQYLLFFPNKIVAFCTNRTWHCQTNISEYVTMPKTGVVVPQLAGWDVLDESIGVYNYGSLQEIDGGAYIMLTSESGSVGKRRFDGFKYGPNELIDRRTGQATWLKKVRGWQKANASLYDGNSGYVVWGRE